MRKQNKLIAIVILILSTISTALTFFAPLATETTEGLFNTYSDSVSLFTGIDSGLCVTLTVVAGACLILFSFIGLIGNRAAGIGSVGAGISGIVLLIMQIICTMLSMSYYDDSSLFSALRSEISTMSVHPVAIVTMIVTLTAVILCFKAKPGKESQSASTNADEQ